MFSHPTAKRINEEKRRQLAKASGPSRSRGTSPPVRWRRLAAAVAAAILIVAILGTGRAATPGDPALEPQGALSQEADEPSIDVRPTSPREPLPGGSSQPLRPE